jgi:hypothetical protein
MRTRTRTVKKDEDSKPASFMATKTLGHYQMKEHVVRNITGDKTPMGRRLSPRSSKLKILSEAELEGPAIMPTPAQGLFSYSQICL